MLRCCYSRRNDYLALLCRYGSDMLAYLLDFIIEGSLFLQVPQLIGIGLGLEVALDPSQIVDLPFPLTRAPATFCRPPA